MIPTLVSELTTLLERLQEVSTEKQVEILNMVAATSGWVADQLGKELKCARTLQDFISQLEVTNERRR